MGQKKNKWKRDNAEQPRRRRWGNGGNTAATTEGDDDLGPYTKTSGRNRKKRGSGKLRGQANDDNPVLDDEEASIRGKNGGKAPNEGIGGEEEHRASEGGTQAETSPSKPDRSRLPSAASMLDTEAGLSRALPPEKESASSTTIDRQEEGQVQAKGPEGAVQRSRKDDQEKYGGVKDDSGALTAGVREGGPVAKLAAQLDATTSALKSCNGSSDGIPCSDADSNGLRADSCPSPKGTLLSANGMVLVPALSLGSYQSNRESLRGNSGHTGATEVIMNKAPYSLAWTGGRKGRSLMRTVQDALSGWLCTQDAKGRCIEAEIKAIERATGSAYAPLGRLSGELGMPGPVLCAVGLRFRGRDWEELQNKIVSARDFLDLKAESACSAALSAFGSEVSAPRPTDEIPLDALASLAREEAAGFELAELELRQALRAEASRIAPRACPWAARVLFERLDPTASGIIAESELLCLAFRLLGLAPPDGAEHSPHPSRPYHTAEIGLSSVPPGAGIGLSSVTPRAGIATGTPHGVAAPSRNGGRRSTTTDYATPGVGNASCGAVCSRTRRFQGVITRLARTAADEASSRPGKNENNSNARSSSLGHGGSTRERQGGSGRVSTARGEESRGRTLSLGVPPVRQPSFSSAAAPTVRRDDEETGSYGHALITLSAFCRFVEGKRFDGAISLEGFLRTLSRAGRSLAPSVESGVVVQQTRIVPDQASFSAATGERNTSPVEGGAWGTETTARWGTGGVRRASLQFSHSAARTTCSGFVSPAAGMTVDEKRTTMIAQARWDRYGGICNSVRSGVRGELYPTSRSGGPVPSGMRGGGFLEQSLSSFDSDGSGTLSSADLISAASQVAGLVTPARQEWGDILTKRFAKGVESSVGLRGDPASWRRGSTGPTGGGKAVSVRWLGGGLEGNTNGRLDIAALVDFLRPKSFNLSVMTPFGLVELSLEDPCLTLGGLREIMVKKMFWRQHNCQVRRSDRNNFTLSRYYGALPLDTESAGQRRRLVLDVLRPGELIFVTDRPASRSRHEESRIPVFEYMMEARRHRGRADTSGINTRESSKGVEHTDKTSTSGGLPRRRQTSSDVSVRPATYAGGSPRMFSAPAPSGSSSSQPPQPLVEHALSIPRSISDKKKKTTSMNKVSVRSEILSATAVREGATTDRAISRRSMQPLAGSRGTPTADIAEPARDRLGGREAAYHSPLVFDWGVDEVERWIGETLELDCCREAFRAHKIDGSSLAGLTQEKLVQDLGVRNAFHSRKIVLHIERFMAETLGTGAQGKIPLSIPNWRNRDFLMWCWQHVGIRHRPTLALLHQAGVDGLVLLAMEADSWLHLAEASPSQSCIAPLESIRRASEALLPRSQTGNAVLLTDESSALEHNDIEMPRTVRKGADERDTGANGMTNISSVLDGSRHQRFPVKTPTERPRTTT